MPWDTVPQKGTHREGVYGIDDDSFAVVCILFSFFFFFPHHFEILSIPFSTHAAQVFSLILHILGYYIYQSIYHQIMLLELGYCKMGDNMLCLFLFSFVFHGR